MDNLGEAIHHHSSAALLGEVLAPILRVHMLFRKIAVFVLEAPVVHGDQFTKNLALHLLHEVVNRISVDEMPFFGIVSVQVEIKRQSVLLLQMQS